VESPSQFLHSEKDILHSRIIILKIQPRIFFIATRVLFLEQEFSYFLTLVKKKKIIAEKKFLSKNKILVARKNILGCILRIIILELRISFCGYVHYKT